MQERDEAIDGGRINNFTSSILDLSMVIVARFLFDLFLAQKWIQTKRGEMIIFELKFWRRVFSFQTGIIKKHYYGKLEKRLSWTLNSVSRRCRNNRLLVGPLPGVVVLVVLGGRPGGKTITHISSVRIHFYLISYLKFIHLPYTSPPWLVSCIRSCVKHTIITTQEINICNLNCPPCRRSDPRRSRSSCCGWRRRRLQQKKPTRHAGFF